VRDIEVVRADSLTPGRQAQRVVYDSEWYRHVELENKEVILTSWSNRVVTVPGDTPVVVTPLDRIFEAVVDDGFLSVNKHVYGYDKVFTKTTCPKGTTGTLALENGTWYFFPHLAVLFNVHPDRVDGIEATWEENGRECTFRIENMCCEVYARLKYVNFGQYEVVESNVIRSGTKFTWEEVLKQFISTQSLMVRQ
jgi:hypothetical protein